MLTLNFSRLVFEKLASEFKGNYEKWGLPVTNSNSTENFSFVIIVFFIALEILSVFRLHETSRIRFVRPNRIHHIHTIENKTPPKGQTRKTVRISHISRHTEYLDPRDAQTF